MADLENAIRTINESAERTDNSTAFVDDWVTATDTTDLTNPNNGKSTPSAAKKVKEVTEALFAASESDINDAVEAAENSATAAQGYANFQGSWASATGAWSKGNSFDHNGRTWSLLVDLADITTVEPGSDTNTWRAIISDDFGAVTGGDFDVVKHRRGTAAEIAAGTPAIGELWFNTTDNSIHMGDGVTQGGIKHTAVSEVFIEDYGVSPLATPAANSEAFNRAIAENKGKKITSVLSGVVEIDAPIDIIHRCTIDLPTSLTITKTSSTVGSIQRTITPAGQPTQTYTFNKNCMFNIIPETDTINYAIYVVFRGGTLTGPADSSVGVFDAPMCAYSTIDNVVANYTSFFWEGLDNFQMTMRQIRSRFSAKHFECLTGTSWHLDRVACDGGSGGGSTGVGFRLGVSYTVMNACAADKLQNSYELSQDGDFILNGCGSESFGRLLFVKDNARVTLNGCTFQYDIVDSNVGVYAEPWRVSDDASVYAIGTVFSAANFSSSPDNTAAAGLVKPLVTGNGTFTSIDCSHPSEALAVPDFLGDKYNIIDNGKAIWETADEILKYSADTVNEDTNIDKSKQKKSFSISAAVDGAWKTIATFDLSGYGTSVSASVDIDLFSTYAGGVGFSGKASCLIAGLQESSGGGLQTDIAFDAATGLALVDFVATQPAPAVELRFVESGTDALLQIKLTSGGGSYQDADVKADIEYTGRIGTSFKRISIS